MEHENLKNAETLLEHVHLLIKKNDELLDATGARFNMFKVCGVNHYENTHSAIIAEFLNPNGSHGMDSVFLEAFLKVLPQNDDSPDDAFEIKAENCRVGTEVFTGDGRMDILITDDTYAICIENKVYAGDQQVQLKKYKDYLTKKYPNRWKICYLTLDGHSASENSGDGVGYSKIAYSSDIVNWLEECIKISAEKPMLRETLCQYRNHIKKLTGTNLEKKCMEELIELISKNAENYNSAKQIARIFDQAQDTIVNENIKPFLDELKKIIEAELPDSTIDMVFSNGKVEKKWISREKWSGFKFSDKSWNFGILFEFTKENYGGLAVRIVRWPHRTNASFTLPENYPDIYTKNIPIVDVISGKLKFDKENEELLAKCKGILNTMLSILKKA